MSQSASVKTLSCTKVLAGERMTVFCGAAGAKSLSASTSTSLPELRLIILAASKPSPSKESTLLEPSSATSSGSAHSASGLKSENLYLNSIACRTGRSIGSASRHCCSSTS
ncbi:hypothetical protein BDR07DRAFT_237220 [Suillus spraguei]|nr:hypothetical protein BDR07DRAFT_237220 [Suillus spraguei]